MPARVLVLGLDSLDERIVDEAAAAGWAPALAGLLDRAVRAPTHWPRPLGTAALWASLWTGAHPARHRHPFWGETPDRRSAGECRVRPVYARAAAAGRRVAVVDAPYAPYVPTRGKALHVANWLTHDRQTTPVARGRAGDLQAGALAARHLGPAGWCGCDRVPREAEAHARLADRLVERIERQAAALETVLGAADLDLAIGVFAATHCAVHHLWPASPAPRALETVVRAADRAVGRLVRAAGPDATVVLLSGQGARPRTTASHVHPDLLARTFARLPPALRARAARSPTALVRPTPRHSRRAWRAVPYHEYAGAVRLQRRGRDHPRGLSRADADRLVAALAEEADALRDLDTGAPAVSEVVVTAARWPDADVATWPDVFLVWNEKTPLERVGSPHLGELSGVRWGHRSGDHRGRGFLAVAGRAPPHRLDAPVSVFDVAPTIASLVGLPADVDGAPLAAALQDHARTPSS